METIVTERRRLDVSPAPAGALTLERRADGRLWAVRGDAERAVWVRRCFPWSEPTRFVSRRDSISRAGRCCGRSWTDGAPKTASVPRVPILKDGLGTAQR